MPEPDSASTISTHQKCFACGQHSPHGMHLDFRLNNQDQITCAYTFDNDYEGYPGIAHGGIVATVLDAAMTHWLFAHGTPGVTARLNIRYRHPVELHVASEIQASLKEASAPVYVLTAKLIQNGQVKATADATFMSKAELTSPGTSQQKDSI